MSQSILPGNFSVNSLSVIERRRLEYYYEQYILRRSWIYGEGHFILACYAAMPVVLTPDLLYKLWLNFKDYLWEDKPAVIHPVAPADLLLSPLVEEIGHELYEMPESIRQVLLLHLKEVTNEFAPNPQKLHSLNKIAQFLHSYAQYDFTPANKNDDAFREAQIWTAMSYLDPGQAFGQLVNKYKQAKDKSPDQLRYANAIGSMSRRFMLDIVRDPAMVPPAYKAVTALTSVVKDVFNDRDPARLAELQREIQNSDEKVLTDEPVLKENVINIEVDELVTAKLVGVQKKKGKGKLRALVVGVTRKISGSIDQIMENDLVSAGLIARLLANKTANALPESELTMLAGGSATKSAILDAWNSMVENTNMDDNLLFYLGGPAIGRDGHCCIVCEDIGETGDDTNILMDAEIGRIAERKQVASITMIIQTDHAGTEYWLDTNVNNHVVFAACKYGQLLNDIIMPANLFTISLEKALREKQMQISNRNLFVLALEYYHDELVAKNNDDRVWDKSLPVLLCNNKSYDLFFTQGRNKQVALQNALRDTGFYTGDITGVWDTYTSKALVTSGLPVGLSKRRYIKMLIEQKETRYKEEPVFLFIFSDPGNKLQELERERQQIITALTDESLTNRVQIHQLYNPDSSELMDYFINPANRNRIQLVYYSGFDEKGNFLLKDGAFAIGAFLGLLEYQQNIQLFVSNTCRSEYFAAFVSMLGVPLSIGVRGEISDSEGADFGIELFKTIVAGQRLSDVPNLGRPLVARESRFVLYGKDPDTVLPWKFKEDVKKIKVFISYAEPDHLLMLALRNGIESNWPEAKVSCENSIHLSETVGEHFDKGLAEADVVIVMVSAGYANSRVCIEEWNIIRKKAGKPVIPVHVDRSGDIEGIPGIWEFEFFALPYPLVDSDNRYIALTDILEIDSFGNVKSGDSFELYLKHLIENIEKKIARSKEATVFIAKDHFPSMEKDILGREELLQQIEQRLSRLTPLLLSGTIGMGKTTVAMAFCNKAEYTSKYDYVIWVDGNTGFYNGIREALTASLELRKLLNEHINDLHAVLNQLMFLSVTILIVIDNANDPDELQVITNTWPSNKSNIDCLIVTRCNFVETDIRVGPLSLADAGVLYRRFNQKVFQEETFKEIYDHINGNNILIEALAKFCNNSPRIENTGQLLVWLQSLYETAIFNNPEFVGEVSLNFSFKLGHLEEDIKDVVRLFSLFPAREFPIHLLNIVLGDGLAERISLLVRQGWLEQVERAYKMPFIVKELIRSELKPDAENCLQLIKRLRELIGDQDVEVRSDLLSIGVSIVKKIEWSGSNEGYMELGKLQFILGKQLMDFERIDEGIDMASRSITSFTLTLPSFEGHVEGLQLLGELYYRKGDLGGSSHAFRECRQLIQEQVKIVSGSRKDELLFQLIIVYHKIGSLHYELKEYETAIKSYTDALQLNKTLDKRGLMADWIIKLGIKCYEDIGEVYLETERHDLALVSFEEGLSLLNKWGDFEGADEIKNSLEVKIKQTQNRLDKQTIRGNEFLTETELFSLIERSGKLSTSDKPLKSLILFQTENQQTWLVATSLHIFIIVDNERERNEGRLLQYQMEKNNALSIETKPGENEASRRVKFAAQGMWWFYNLSLFPTDEILLRALNELVSEQKSEKSILSGLQLKMPPATYLPWDGSTVIKVDREKQQAFLVDRTLVCFAADVIGQQRRDVIDMLLLAQLAARKQYPEMEQAKDWHQSFTNVLTNIGCTIEAKGFSKFAFPDKTFRFENPIRNIMANASLKYSLTEFLMNSLAAIKRFGNNSEIGRAFEKNVRSSYKVAFQVCLVTNSEETLELNIGMIVITSDSPIIKLFDAWSTENTRLDYITLSCKVNEHLYTNVRDIISEKLIYISVRYVMGI